MPKKIIGNMIVGGMYILLGLLILMLLEIFPALFIAFLIVADSVILIVLTMIFIRGNKKDDEVWRGLSEQLEKLKDDFEKRKR